MGLVRTVPRSGWFLSSEDNVISQDLRDHLNWLLGQLLPVGAAIAELQVLPGLQMNVNCIWWSKAGSGGPVLWPEQMQGLTELNLECSFECSFYGDTE